MSLTHEIKRDLATHIRFFKNALMLADEVSLLSSLDSRLNRSDFVAIIVNSKTEKKEEQNKLW